MTIVLARRLQGFHALLEMALRDERSRPRPDARTVAGIKKKKLAIKDRLAVFDGRQMSSGSRQDHAGVWFTETAESRRVSSSGQA